MKNFWVATQTPYSYATQPRIYSVGTSEIYIYALWSLASIEIFQFVIKAADLTLPLRYVDKSTSRVDVWNEANLFGNLARQHGATDWCSGAGMRRQNKDAPRRSAPRGDTRDAASPHPCLRNHMQREGQSVEQRH